MAHVETVNGIPTPASSTTLYEAMDYYGAVLAYLWAMPAMGLKGWENANVDMGADPSLDGRICLYQGYDGAAGILTPNTEVTYVISFVDTHVHGPAVWVIPPGSTAGYVGDQWQRPILDTGVTGPDRGEGVKLLIVGPENEVPDHDGSYTVVESPTNVVWLGTRNMAPKGPEHDRINAAFDSYPFGSPKLADRVKFQKGTGAFKQYQPHGMAFWENLNAMVQREVMADRDLFFYAILQNLGIEKGKPFSPSPEQISLLEEAERVGYLMAVNNSFKKRIDGARYYPDRRWYVALINTPDQVQPTHGELFERASWFHEAIGSTRAMKLSKPGPGSTYLGQYEDSQGIGFDGGKNYRLVVPADVPAGQFWALTVYESDSRTLIRNQQKKAEINSLNNVTANDDGTTTLYIGPDSPKGMESNWIQTAQGQNWFTYFRLYEPRQPYFDKSWVLNDIEQMP
ncbi:DUF1214 domain-containing protein [Desulfoluna butyratoxydans]|uniref:DUF1214 domain-containing protein n=1 Tax=Desulfoluna butyratoxydans TaxID=231438 RepID=UPI0015D238A4|nr:DUF1214 domain-containing protein [Desulfoluna butyratoxydans]